MVPEDCVAQGCCRHLASGPTTLVTQLTQGHGSQRACSYTEHGYAECLRGGGFLVSEQWMDGQESHGPCPSSALGRSQDKAYLSAHRLVSVYQCILPLYQWSIVSRSRTNISSCTAWQRGASAFPLLPPGTTMIPGNPSCNFPPSLPSLLLPQPLPLPQSLTHPLHPFTLDFHTVEVTVFIQTSILLFPLLSRFSLLDTQTCVKDIITKAMRLKHK